MKPNGTSKTPFTAQAISNDQSSDGSIIQRQDVFMVFSQKLLLQLKNSSVHRTTRCIIQMQGKSNFSCSKTTIIIIPSPFFRFCTTCRMSRVSCFSREHKSSNLFRDVYSGSMNSSIQRLHVALKAKVPAIYKNLGQNDRKK